MDAVKVTLTIHCRPRRRAFLISFYEGSGPVKVTKTALTDAVKVTKTICPRFFLVPEEGTDLLLLSDLITVLFVTARTVPIVNFEASDGLLVSQHVDDNPP